MVTLGRWRLGLFCALAALASAPPAEAQTSGSAFLNISPSVRSYALGSADAVAAYGAEAIGSNPANLQLSGLKYDVMSSYATVLDGAEFEHLAAAMSPEKLGMIESVGVSLTRLQISGLQGADATGAKTGKGFGSNDTAVTVAVSGSPRPNLHVGFAAKAIQETISTYHSNVPLAADFGATYVFSTSRSPMTIAASLLNVGMRTKYISQSDPLPLSLKVGAALPMDPFTGVIQLSDLIYDRQFDLGVGVEYAVRAVSFRVGFHAADVGLRDQSAVQRLFTGMTAGIGAKFGDARFDYALSQQTPDFQATHRVAFSMKWGGGSNAARNRARLGAHDDPGTLNSWVLQAQGGL